MKIMNTTATPMIDSASIEPYLAAGQREFSRHASRIAELERDADLDPGSLAKSMLGGLFDQFNNDPAEWADFFCNGWEGMKEEHEVEAMIRPLCERWRQEGLRGQFHTLPDFRESIPMKTFSLETRLTK